MHSLQKPEETDVAKTASGYWLKPAHVGKINGMTCNNQGMEVHALQLQRVAHAPNTPYNVIIVSFRLMNGWELAGNKDAITLSKGNAKVTFDIKIHTAKGVIYAVYIKRTSPQVEANGAIVAARTLKMNIRQAHDRLGHIGEDMTRSIAEQLGWTLTRGTLGVCQGCAEAKAKKKSVPQATDGLLPTPDKRRYSLDLSTLMDSHCGKRTRWVWRILIEQLTQFKFTDFFDSKTQWWNLQLKSFTNSSKGE